MRSIIVIAAIALAVGVLAPRYLSNIGPAPAPAAPQVQPPPSSAAADARSRSVVIARNAQGHFDVDGRVNGRRIDFVRPMLHALSLELRGLRLSAKLPEDFETALDFLRA